MRCPHCGVAMTDATTIALPPVAGAHGELKLAIESLPAVRCVKGHHAPVDEDFMFWMIQELKERAAAIPGGEEKGMILKKHLCSCGKPLEPKPERRQAFPQDFTYEGKYKFKGALDVAMHKCTGCGKEQARSSTEIRKDIAHAMADVTDAAGFPHG